MSIYLDYAAATPQDSRVTTAMQPYFSQQFYNPSSPYLAARQVRTDLEQARSRVAHWLGAKPTEVIFTAGATESINLAIHGVMQRFPSGHLLISAIEHDAVRKTADPYNHSVLPVLPSGALDLEKLDTAITDHTVLVSIGYANNEIGTIQPLHDIAAVLEKHRAKRQKSGHNLPLYLHTDASQAASYLDLHASRLGVDLLTLNGGKIYGPKQTGVLYIKTGSQLTPLITGGGQESGLRSGTENVAGAIGFATALDIAQTERKNAIAKQSALRDELERRLLTTFPHAQINGNRKKRLPNNLHISWPGIDGERLVMQLDESGLQAATGSACAANKNTASHVLKAIGLDGSYIQGSLRLSLGTPTTSDQISAAADIIIKCLKQL